MAGEVFGATIAIKDNVSGVLKSARESSKGFRGEVEKAKQELKKFDEQKLKEKEIRIKNTAAYKAIEGVKEKLEPVMKKVIQLKAKEEAAVSKIKRVARELGKVKDSKVVKFAVEGTEKVLKGIGKAAVIGTAAAFTAVAVASAGAVKSAVDYQNQMQAVGTLLDGDVSGTLQRMSGDLKKVSINTGASLSDLSAGLYDVVSAFGESEENVKQLEIASKAAKAGAATTSDSVALLSAVTKGYGDTSAAAMQKASDLAFQTVKLGQTTFPELASSIGQVVPLASTLKVSQEELFGAMATLTGVTGGTAEVTTQLKATMQGFLSPSNEMAKSLKALGYESGAAALEQEGLDGILKKLKDSVNGDEVAFANLFSSVEAKNAVLALAGNQAENFSTKTAAMVTASGAADKAFKTQTASVSEMMGKVKNAGSVMLTSLGEKALPYITAGLEKLVEKLPEMEKAFDRVAERAGPILETVAGAVQDAYNTCRPIVEQMAGTIGNAFIAAKPAVDTMISSVQSMLPYIQPVLESVVGVVSSAIPVVADIFSGLSAVAAAVFPVVSEIIADVGPKISGIFSSISGETGTLRSAFETAGPVIAEVLQTMWAAAGPILDVVISTVGLVASAFRAAWPLVSGVVQEAWAVIGPIFDTIGKGLSVVADAIDTVSSRIGGKKGGGKGASGSGGKQNATGTSFSSGGWSTVGEHGPELMKLPAGTQIKPNSALQNSAPVPVPAANGGSGGGGTTTVSIVIEKMEVREEADIEKIAEKIVEKIEDAADNS
ncbi:MAG: phage tail tape measure protein [Lachnospiraceae bacterium]|nr:phage tail tape measure protein [Lachnospiraceae bacterium]